MTEMDYKFIDYVAKHAKSYATLEEYQHRLSIFAETDKQIEEFNANETTSVHGHNKFSDLTAFEKSKFIKPILLDDKPG
jgi:peptidase E